MCTCKGTAGSNPALSAVSSSAVQRIPAHAFGGVDELRKRAAVSIARSNERSTDGTLTRMTAGTPCSRFAGGLALLLLGATGCRRSNPEPSLPSEKGSLPAPLKSGTDERTGCRSPEEPGCDQCCVQGSLACTSYSADPGSADYGWLAYRFTGRRYGSCSSSCPACARCSRHAESELRERRAARPECNCALPLNEDPCFVGNSCECFCERLLPLTNACPSLAGPM